MPAMGTGLPEHDGTCNDATIAYYRRRAEGGVGMITIEASLVSPDAYGVGPELRLHGEEYIPGLRRLVEALRPVRDPDRDPALAPGPADPARRADRAVARAALLPDADPARAHARGDPHARRLLRALGLGLAAGRLRLRRGPRRALLPPVRVHLAALEPPHRRVRRPAREPRPVPARDRGRDPRALRRGLSGHVPDQRGRGRRGRLRGRGRRRRLPDARGGGRVRDQRLGGQLVRAPPDDRPDVPSARLPRPARGHDQAGRERPRDRGRQARRRGPGGEDPRRRRCRPDRDRPCAHRRSRPAEEVAGGKARRDPPLHRLQRLRRPRREREAGPVRRQPRGRSRGRLGASCRRRRRAA